MERVCPREGMLYAGANASEFKSALVSYPDTRNACSSKLQNVGSRAVAIDSNSARLPIVVPFDFLQRHSTDIGVSVRADI
jgi:hypothetical protein